MTSVSWGMELTPAPLAELGPSTPILAPVRYHRPPPVLLDLADMEATCRRHVDECFAQLAQDVPAVTHHVMAGATLVGQGTVVTADGRVVYEAAYEFLRPGNVPDGLERFGEGFRLKPATEMAVERPSLLAKRPWAQNFGHFLVDAAALVTLADRLGLPSDAQIVITRFENPRLRATAHEVLAAMVPGVIVVEHPDTEVWRLRRLHYVSPIQSPPLSKRPEPLAMLRAALLRRHRGRLAGPRRIFVSRGFGRSRSLVNEDAIVAVCAARGFAVVQPGLDPIEEQAALFRRASLVVGVKGAALTNLMFATAGATALVLTPADFPDPFFWDLCAHAGVRYAEMAGPLTTDLPRGQNSFTIDPDRFAAVLDALISEGDVVP